MVYFAPLQSYTTLPYYFAFESQIGGINKYFTPFYRKNKQGFFEFEKQLFAHKAIHIIPQVLTNNRNDLTIFAKEMINRGFDEINLNIGCPFPMVTNRHLGSGLLPYPNEIKDMLEGFYSHDLPIKLSVKTRLGWQDSKEIQAVIEVLNNYPIHELILHPRLGIQKYRGLPDWDSCYKIANLWNGELIGNGNINSANEIKEKQTKFKHIKGWMLGRGLLSNPLIHTHNIILSEQLITTLQNLHDAFYHQLVDFGYSDAQILNHLKCFWEYPSKNFVGGERIYRKLRKIGKMEDYWKMPPLLFEQPLFNDNENLS